MVNVAFRVSRAYDSDRFTDVIRPLSTHADATIIYFHDISENPHMHGYIEGYNKSEKWFRETLKVQFGLKLKTEYSCKFEANRSFITYMSKGKLDPVYVDGINGDEILEYKSKGYDKGDIVKPPKIPVDGKKTKWDMLHDMRDIVANKGYDYNLMPDKVIGVIIKVLRENKQVIGEYKVKDYFDSLSMYENTDSFISRMVHKIFPS